MFRNRYVSFNYRKNYIRQPRNTFNAPLDDKEIISDEETDYEETDDYEIPNETETDYVLIPNEDLLNEVSNDGDLDYEDFFDNKILSDNDEMTIDSDNEASNEDEPDKIIDKSLNSEQMPPISGEFAPYFNNITEALMFCWIQKHNICKY